MTTERYADLLKRGWRSGVHDCRHLNYADPWLVVDQEAQTVRGFQTRQQARSVWEGMKCERQSRKAAAANVGGDTDV